MSLSKKSWIALIFIAIISGISIATAVQMWMYGQTSTVPPEGYTMYLEDEVWANGTAIDWGDTYPGNTYYYNLTVESLVPSNTTVWLEVVDLPLGWTETWDANATLLGPEESVFGWLNLTIPSDAEAGEYSWDSYIKGEYT